MLSPGTRAGEYVLGRRVAVGATSDVYEGRHFVTGAPVAVKVLGSSWCAHAEVVARFLNEARTLLRLQHPHLVQALAVGVLPEGPPFIILEWLPVDLERALAQAGGRLGAAPCAQVIRQLAEVLALLHAQGLVHRDLKPANVLVAREPPGGWEVKLADLGLAKRSPLEGAEASALPVSTAGSALLGTWDFMAPEQWMQSKRVDLRVDVYALGVLWFRMLSGRLPFLGDGPQRLMFLHLFEPPPLHLLEGTASAETRALVGRMLGKRPAERPGLEEVLARVSGTSG